MKYKDLFLDVGLSCRPKLKCGPESLVPAALITGGLGLFGSGISATSASRNNSKALDASSAENEKLREWQEKMYGVQHNDMLTDTVNAENRANLEYRKRQQLALDSMREMTNWIYKNYQSPAAQAKALRAAGFNPAMMIGKSSGGFGVPLASSPSVDVPTSQYSMPGVPSSSMMSPPQLQNAGLAFSQGLEGISNSVSALMSADKTSQETYRLRQTHQLFIETAMADKLSAQSNAERQALALSLDKLNLPKKQKFEIEKLQRDIDNAVIFGEYNKAQTAYTEIQTKLADISLKKGSIELESYRDFWKMHMYNLSAEIALNRQRKITEQATAGKLSAETKTIDATREWQVEVNKMQALIARSDNTIKQASVQAHIEMLANQAVQSGLATKEQQERIQLLIKEKNYYELGKFLGAIGSGALVGALVK